MDKNEVGKAHKPKITMTEKQKATRIASSANGRKKGNGNVKTEKRTET